MRRNRQEKPVEPEVHGTISLPYPRNAAKFSLKDRFQYRWNQGGMCVDILTGDVGGSDHGFNDTDTHSSGHHDSGGDAGVGDD